MKKLFPLIACSLVSTLIADSPSTPKGGFPITPYGPEALKSDGVTYNFYGECLYLQPNGSNLNYGVEAIGLDPAIAVPAVSPNWKVLEINPDYHFGFEIGASVLLNDPNLSIELNWERLYGKDKDSFTASPATGYMVGPFFDIGPNSASYKVAKGNVTSHFDEVDLSFGKDFSFFSNFYTHFYGGAAFARIKQRMNSSYSNVAETISRSVGNSSTFIGAGPQIGLDYSYRVCQGFFFIGNSTLSLFMGQMKNSLTFQSYSPELAALSIAQPNSQETTISNRTQLIPAFEQKLGFSYIAKWTNVSMTFEVGYRCQVYVNAVQTIDMTAPQVLPSGAIFTPQVGVFAVGFERTLSNYILTGPYARLGVDF